MTSRVTLRAGDDVVVVDPEAGGRIASAVLGGRERLVTAPPPHLPPDDAAMQWGVYVMAPWAGRIAGARLRWGGDVHRLPARGEHALHGVTHDLAWVVEGAASDLVVLSCDLGDAGWPLGGTMRHEIALESGRMRCRSTVTAGGRPMPVWLGWHPCFARRPEPATPGGPGAPSSGDPAVETPDGPTPGGATPGGQTPGRATSGGSRPAAAAAGAQDEHAGGGSHGEAETAVSLRIDSAAVLDTDRMIPTGRLVPVAGALDLREGPALGARRLDHTYVEPSGPATVSWSDLVLDVGPDRSTHCLVVYTPPHMVCVEPQTAWPDAVRLDQAGIGGTGLDELPPGGSTTATMTWTWRSQEES